MTSKLHISLDLILPPDFVTSTGVIYGGKGTGKTTLASVLIEELTKARLRWALLDPMGVSWGLRHSKDGKGPGISCVILGGVHGDIPVLPTGGAVVADLVVDEGANTIIDFSRHASGKMWSKAERIRFVTDYTTRLFERQGETIGGKRREPLMQILDEAARYIPQQIPANSPMLAECVGAWEQVCEEGRNIGLGVTFVTQRSARMNKSVSELADVMFAFRTVGPNSLSAVMDWLGEHVEKSRIKDLAAAVRELEIGHALVVSPGWLRTEKIVKIRDRETFDSSATPKPGQKRQRVTGRAAKPDLAKYETKMAATIEAAKANDPRELQKTITDLRRQLAAKPLTAAPAKIDVRPEIDRQIGIYQKEIKRVSSGVVIELKKVAALLEGAGSRVVSAADDLGRLANAPVSSSVPDRPGTQNPIPARVRPPSMIKSVQHAPSRAPAPTPSRPATQASGDLSPGHMRILDALAELSELGFPEPSRAQLGMMAGYNLSGGTGAQNLADLVTRELVEIPKAGAARLSESGARMAGPVAPPNSLADLHERMMRKMGDGHRRIAEHLIRIYPDAISRVDLGAAVNYNLSGGTGAQNLADLVTMGAVRIPRAGMVQASDILFPNGLR